MNKRIRELADEAVTRVALRCEGSMESDKHGEWIRYDDLEKFAELIVRECAELSVNSQYANTKSEYYEGFNEALVYAGNKIRKHFGVEE